MNRELIQEHEKIIEKVNRGEKLTENDLDLIRDANEIHLNDGDDIDGHHRRAVGLNEWLERRIKMSKEEAVKILKKYLDRNSHTPAKVYRALHTLWEEATPKPGSVNST